MLFPPMLNATLFSLVSASPSSSSCVTSTIVTYYVSWWLEVACVDLSVMSCGLVSHRASILFILWAFIYFPVFAQSRWPPGTQVVASSTLACNGIACFSVGNAIDGDNNTLWSDKTANQFPDVLTIGAPTWIKLTGLSIVSSINGWITAYRIEALVQNSSWVQIAQVRDIISITSEAEFTDPVECIQVRIVVDNATSGDMTDRFSRINEVVAHAVDEHGQISNNASSPASTGTTTSGRPVQSSSTNVPTASSMPKSKAKLSLSDKGIIIGSVLGGCSVLSFIAYVIITRFKVRRQRSSPPEILKDRMIHEEVLRNHHLFGIVESEPCEVPARERLIYELD